MNILKMWFGRDFYTHMRIVRVMGATPLCDVDGVRYSELRISLAEFGTHSGSDSGHPILSNL